MHSSSMAKDRKVRGVLLNPISVYPSKRLNFKTKKAALERLSIFYKKDWLFLI
ncbi:hypothetical protein SAMN06265377_3932 [Flagellimonas pacifica]|uniref:Uncharacterized protein n=1 Tax=Flagellimonas pacifica TaxID=1247520 RepID=A0A285MZG6_9FLAO|nr:hypothetical protein SAMN06265377_3932 [Allomuricauda parva]